MISEPEELCTIIHLDGSDPEHSPGAHTAKSCFLGCSCSMPLHRTTRRLLLVRGDAFRVENKMKSIFAYRSRKGTVSYAVESSCLFD